MTKWTIPQDVALPPRAPEAHTIYAQQARIAELEAIILEALRAPDDDRTEILRRGVREGVE